MGEPAADLSREEYASTAEVMAAIESLSAEGHHRLKKYAQWRVRGLGRAAEGRTYHSLLAEAVVATLEGTKGEGSGRTWRKNRVSFVKHLLGAMRSISTHWKDAYERRGAEAERFDHEVATEDEGGNLVRPSETAVDLVSDPLRSYAANELLHLLDRHFDKDKDALLVVEARKAGMTVGEMVAEFGEWGLTEKKVKAALGRIRHFMERYL